MTEQNQIEENKEKIVSQLLLAFPAHTHSAQHIDEILEIDNIMDTLRISQIDIIDMLSQPTLELSDIYDIIKQHNLLPLPEGQRPSRWQTVEQRIEKHLKPYGITKQQWKGFHDDHYDAFDFPLIPKRSLSIPIDNGLSGAWAPNGYGKTFMFKVLKLLQETKTLQFGPKKALTTQELFTDFLTKCTSLLHPIHSTTPLPYDGQRESPPAPRLIPFRQICFSIEALKDNHPTEFFSVRIEVEYEDTGKVADYSLHLLAPNIADSLVVEGNIKLPNWINTNYHLEQISQDTLSGNHHTQWPIAALEKLLCLNVNYIEIPLLAYEPNAGEFVQKNINTIVDNLLDDFTSHAYDDIEIDKYGLISNLADQQERYLLDSLNKLYKELAGDEVIDETDYGLGMNALRALINKITLVQKELNILVNNDVEGWGVLVKIRTPTGENSLDILESETSNSMKSWGRLSFGQRNDLILQSTLAQYQHCYNANNAKDQVVLVIDEPEAGRSESWVNQLMHKLSTHVSTHPILILSHRGMVLESINSSGEYQIMHTVKPDIDEEEESFKDYGVLQSKLSTTVRESLAFISAFSSIDSKHPHALIFPKTFTPTKDWLLLSEGAKGKHWILKPTSIDKGTLTEIEQLIDRDLNLYDLPNEELFLMLWNGISWVTSDISKAFWHYTAREWAKPQTQVKKRESFSDAKIKYIHVGGLGLPKLEGLIFVLTHLPSHAAASSDVKALKKLATQEGLKISSTRIRNVRTIIHKVVEGAPPNKSAPSFTQNLSKFISGLKMTNHSQANMPDKTVLQKYISQLGSFSDSRPDKANTPIESFIDYLKTLGVKTPPQNPEQTTLLDGTADFKNPDLVHFSQEYQKTVEKLIEIKKEPFLLEKKKKHTKSFTDNEEGANLRLRDKGKHPTQASFFTHAYRWTQKTIDSAIMEAEINDYAEELVLQLAVRYVREDDLDIDSSGKIWIRADAFKQAAREIADRDVSSRKYDDFNDKCGQFMLIRADIHGYTCLTCESMYDEKKNNI